jgi:hypothetical protein
VAFAKTRKILQQGLRAAQPAASTVQEGTLYYVTDESVIERSNLTIWQQWTTAGAGTVTHTGALTSGVNVVGNGGADITVSSLTATVVKSAAGTLSAATGGTDYTDLAFKTIAVSGQSDVVADSAADTLTLAAGANVTITTNAGTDTVTIAATGGGGSGTVTNTGTLTAGQLIAGNGGVDVTVTNLTGDVTTSGGVATTLKTAAKTRAITFTIDGGGSVPSTGVKGDISVPYACTITGARMLADQSGSAVVNVWKDTYANYPPTVADKITASAPPTISTATKSDDTTLTGWTTSITAGDTLRFNLDSVTTITRVVLVLTVTV